MNADDPRRDREPNHPLDQSIANAIASRRVAPTRAFQDRLRATVQRPQRVTWLVPAVLAGLVAMAAGAVILLRADRPSREDSDTPMPVLASGSGSSVAPSLPAGPAPAASPEVGELLAPYQAVLDGDARDLALASAQAAKIRDLADELARQRALLAAQREVALIELRRALASGADRSRATAILDRVTAVEAAIRRAELDAKLAVRDVLDAKQRAQLERRSDPSALKSKLMVQTSPAGARVLVDGVVVGDSPVSVSVAGGRHALQFELAGYAAYTATVDVRDGRDQTLAVNLSRKTPPPVASTASTLKVQTTPAGALVAIDGKSVGVSPLIVRIAAGSHRVRITKTGLTARDLTVDVADGESQVVRVALERGGNLGELKNPFDDDEPQIKPAPPSLKPTRPTDPFATDRGSPIDTELERPDAFNRRTAAPVGTLQVMSKPFSEVFVDGKRVGVTPVLVKLSAGVHKVTLVRDNTKETRTVTIKDGITEKLAMDFSQIE